MITRVVLLGWLLLAWGRVAAAAEHAVNSGGPSGSIAQALAQAQAGDVIRLAAGEYRESLVIDTPVTITADGAAAISGSGKGSTVVIIAPGVVLDGLTISGSGRDMLHSDAGVRIKADDCVVRDCTITENLFGVYVDRCRNATIERNHISGIRDLDIGGRGAGVHLYDTQDNRIAGNFVSHVRDGVYFDHADNNVVEDNEFCELRYGVHYMYCGPNEFYRNYFHDNVAGVAIMYTDGVVFSDNQIISNRKGYNAFGLLFQACRECVAERNVIINNTCGLFLEGSRNNVIANNLIAYNDVGAVIYGSSPDNQLQHNDFIGNLATLHTVGPLTMDWAPEGQGNFYDEYVGYDLDQDGIGDNQHRLQDAFEYLEGNHPLLRLYLNSAAADALSAAERTLPLIPGSPQVDAAPQMQPVSGVRATMQLPRSGPGHWLAFGLSAAALMCCCLGYWRLAQ